jgi:predicted AAA+ superfamily ATPase
MRKSVGSYCRNSQDCLDGRARLAATLQAVEKFSELHHFKAALSNLIDHTPSKCHYSWSMLHRISNLSKTNSFFLFGARGTGKSTLVKEHLKSIPHLHLDLLRLSERDSISRDPDSIERRILPGMEWVFIDEVQRVPEVLDPVHRLIEERKIKFALTGSSARKLKAGGANLLAGRAFVFELFPLTSVELDRQFDLEEVLRWGSLPKLQTLKTSEDKSAFLEAYALTYLQEEIWEEHLVRKLQPFRKFLEVAAQCSGQKLSYSNVAQEVNVDTKTVQQYFQILEDTLLCFMLEPFHHSSRKRLRVNPKCYFFDLGVWRALTRSFVQDMVPQTYGYGRAFEHFLITEIHHLAHTRRLGFQFCYLPLSGDKEVDLVVERPNQPPAFIEIKSTDQIQDKHVEVLKEIQGDFPKSDLFCLSRDEREQTFGKVRALPWQKGLRELGLVA